MGGVPQICWHSMSCKRVVYTMPGSRNLDCWRLTLMTPDGVASLLEEPGGNIATVSTELSPLLAGQVPAFKEVIDWIQFVFTGYWTGAYSAPSATVLIRTMIRRGDQSFPLPWPS